MDASNERLIKSILEQAAIFLTDANEFFPFGTAIDFRDNVIPIGVYIGNENPKAQEIAEMLNVAVNAGVINGKYKVAAICIDVLIYIGDQKVNAMQVDILYNQSRRTIYYNYFKDVNGHYAFEEISI